MPSYKLTYFNGRGLAETSRLIFALVGQEYEDIRVPKDKWPEIKPNTPFGMVPILEVDGKKYTQSFAIAMYLGRKFGLYPSDPEEAFKVDEIIFLIQDNLKAALKVRYAKPEEKEELMKEYKEVQSPKFNGFYERMLKENGTGYFVGDKITIADLAIYDFLTRFPDLIPDGSLLKAHWDRIGSLDKIKAWVEKRPKTEF